LKTEDELVKELKPRGTLILEFKGARIIDEDFAKLLTLIKKTGSILSASKILGISYSRAWESIAKVEQILEARIIEPRRGGRGGGGAKLTSIGEKILERYLEEYHRLLGRRFEIMEARIEAPEIIYAGSNDLLLEHILGAVRGEGVEPVEIAWIGSSGGLTLLMLEEADLAGIHLYDPATGQYNLPYLSRYWLEDRVIVVRGYEREIGFASRKEIDNPIEMLVGGEARLINRNLGSGTRIHLDNLLRRKAKEAGIPFNELIRRIKGYEMEVKTHYEVAEAITLGKADLGLTTRWAAERYGLAFKRILWEKFDLAILAKSYRKEAIQKLLKYLDPVRLRKLIEGLAGYRITANSGKIIYGRYRLG